MSYDGEKQQEDRKRAAMDKFRNSVGFQFGFVMYSGLDVAAAIEHICAAAEVLCADRAELLERPTSERCVECKHVKLNPWRGHCQHEVSPFGKRPVLYCGHSCQQFKSVATTGAGA